MLSRVFGGRRRVRIAGRVSHGASKVSRADTMQGLLDLWPYHLWCLMSLPRHHPWCRRYAKRPCMVLTPSSSAKVAQSPQPQISGTVFTPLDKAIAENFPARPWSKNVPDRACTNDNECGDGFCDRGQCAAIWTWTEPYGQKCGTIPVYHPELCSGPWPDHLTESKCEWQERMRCLCIDGRCRSCASDDECVKKYRSPAAGCVSASTRGYPDPPGRHCARPLCSQGPRSM